MQEIIFKLKYETVISFSQYILFTNATKHGALSLQIEFFIKVNLDMFSLQPQINAHALNSEKYDIK